MSTYTNKQVAEITKLSPRLVQFYTKEGVVTPESGGGKRGQACKYSKRNLIDFGIIRQLGAYGMTLKKIHSFLDDFRKPAHGVMDRYSGGIFDGSTRKKKNAFVVFFKNKGSDDIEIEYDPNGEEYFLKHTLTPEKLAKYDSFLVLNIGRIIAKIEENL